MRAVHWIMMAVAGLFLLLILWIGGSFLMGMGGQFGFWTNSWHDMRPGMMMDHWRGPGMMRSWGFGLFGPILGLLAMLVPLGLLALLVLGGIWLVRQMNDSSYTPSTDRPCPNCGRSVRSDWRLCPHCGQSLTGVKSAMGQETQAQVESHHG